MKRWSYFGFILRELSSVFVAWFVIYFLLMAYAVSEGRESYEAFLSWSAHPGVIVLNVVGLFFVGFHAVTWFNLAPQAMVVHWKGKKVPGKWIAASNYVAWALLSALTAWLILGG
jgi:fumarate reductase subunit C